MQVSGGHLLAAGLDGGNTLIFAPRAKMQIESGHRHQKMKGEALPLLLFF
jgi:hypothetical protein